MSVATIIPTPKLRQRCLNCGVLSKLKVVCGTCLDLIDEHERAAAEARYEANHGYHDELNHQLGHGPGI